MSNEKLILTTLQTLLDIELERSYDKDDERMTHYEKKELFKQRDKMRNQIGLIESALRREEENE
jgi:hypothetical protein